MLRLFICNNVCEYTISSRYENRFCQCLDKCFVVVFGCCGCCRMNMVCFEREKEKKLFSWITKTNNKSLFGSSCQKMSFRIFFFYFAYCECIYQYQYESIFIFTHPNPIFFSWVINLKNSKILNQFINQSKYLSLIFHHHHHDNFDCFFLSFCFHSLFVHIVCFFACLKNECDL